MISTASTETRRAVSPQQSTTPTVFKLVAPQPVTSSTKPIVQAAVPKTTAAKASPPQTTAPVKAIPRTTARPAPPRTTVEPPPAPDVYYKNRTAARAAGAAPILRGQPGYRPALDRDDDGVPCE
jgi:hypothetical protein